MKCLGVALAGLCAGAVAFGAEAPRADWSVTVEYGDVLKPTGTKTFVLAEQAALAVTETAPGRWRYVCGRFADKEGAAEVGLVAEVCRCGDKLIFSGRLENRDPKCRVVDFAGPRVAAEKVTNGKSCFYYPYADGIRIRRFPTPEDIAARPDRKRFGFFWMKRADGRFTYHPELVCAYPSRRATMQWMTVTDGAHGVAYVVKDPKFGPKQAQVEYDAATSALSFSFSNRLFLRAGETAELPTTEIVRYRGDWQVAAADYGAWFAKAVKYAPVPEGEMDCTTLMLLICKQQNGKMVWPFTDFAALADALDAYGITNLKILGRGPGGHDYLYPDYTPDPAQGGAAALRKGLALLKARGVRTYAYVNGQLIEQGATDYWRAGGGSTAGVLQRSGKRAWEGWLKYKDRPRHLFDVACPWDKTWLRRMGEVADEALDLGFDGLYMDQTGKQWPWQCFDASHGHRAGDWVWTQDRVDYLMGIHRRTAAKRADFILTSEGFCEPIAGSCAIHLGLRDPETVNSRFDRDAWLDKWPEMTFLAMPRYLTSDRWPAPTRSRDDVNGTAVVNYRLDLEVRYPTDRIVFEKCEQTDYSEYANLVSPPLGAADFPKVDFKANRAYIRAVNVFRRAHRDILLRGDFRDTLGFSVETPAKDWIAKRWVAQDGRSSGVLVWNADREPRTFAVKSADCLRGAFEPEAGQVDPCAPVPPNSLRLYRFAAGKE